MRSIRLSATLALMLGLVAGPLVSVSAAASCAEDSGPEGSDVIFVGTLQEERRGYARLKVEEVWAGPDLADEVWVLSGQEQARWPFYFLTVVGSSNDASFVEDQPYVVGASDDFSTSECSVSWLDEAAERPEARPPAADGLTGANPPIPGWLGILGLLFPVALIVVLLYRRRRAREQLPPAS